MTGLPQHRDAESTSAPQSGLPGAGVWRRLVALVYDSLLLFALLFAAAALYQYAMGQLNVTSIENGVIDELPVPANSLGFQLYLAAVIAAFYCYFWRRSGQTLGMQAWRLRLDSADGGRPTLVQCLRRLAVGLPSLLLGGAGYWWIWLDRERLAWHDRGSGTRVVVLPKDKS